MASLWDTFTSMVGDQGNNLKTALTGYGKAAYKAAVPVNARTLIDTLRGVTDPITEADLNTEDLSALQQVYAERKRSNVDWQKDIAGKAVRTQAEYEKSPDTWMVDAATGERVADGAMTRRMQSAPMPYVDYVRGQMKALDSFEKTKGKTSIGYQDYDHEAAPTFDNPIKSIYKSYTDPMYRMKTLLGNFSVNETPNGPVANDSYNFDARGYYDSFYGNGKKLEDRSNLDIIRSSNGLVDALDQYMIKNHSGVKRDVRIALPTK